MLLERLTASMFVAKSQAGSVASATATSYSTPSSYWPSMDAYGRFVFVDIGAYGRHCDARIFQDTAFYQAMMSGELERPDPRPLPGTNEPLYCFVLADSAFQHHVWLQKGYALSKMKRLDTQTIARLIVNYRICRARRIIEDAFGILVMIFRIFSTDIVASEDLINRIISACCLHNYLLADAEQRFNRTPNLVDCENTATGEIIDAAWRQEVGASELRSVTFANVIRADQSKRKSAIDQRRVLTEWVDSPAGFASAPWQQRCALQSKSTSIVRWNIALLMRVAKQRAANKEAAPLRQQQHRVARAKMRSSVMRANVVDALTRERQLEETVHAVVQRFARD